MNPYLRYFSFALAVVLLGVANSSSSLATSRVMMAVGSQQRCNGSTIAECVVDLGGEEEELLMESEVSRRIRILAENQGYISYNVVNQGGGAACNEDIMGNCLVTIDKYHRPCTYYNHCKRSPS